MARAVQHDELLASPAPDPARSHGRPVHYTTDWEDFTKTWLLIRWRTAV